MLTNVMITGADDSICPWDLASLSKQYPFVEWGILFSAALEGCDRYPTLKWIENFLAHELPCAAHICGQYVDGVVFRRSIEEVGVVEVLRKFDRFQLNYNGKRKPYMHDLIGPASMLWGKLIITQFNKSNPRTDKHSGLHQLIADSSGGRGVVTDCFPKMPEIFGNGYAGGINPENLKEKLDQVKQVGNRTTYWIDMENGVRTDNKFDLDKVESVLRQFKEIQGL